MIHGLQNYEKQLTLEIYLVSYLPDLRRRPKSVLIKLNIGTGAEIICTTIKRDRDKKENWQEGTIIGVRKLQFTESVPKLVLSDADGDLKTVTNDIGPTRSHR